MSRRRYGSPRAFASPRPATQLTSLLMMLFVVGLMYSRARDPSTWRWLAGDTFAAAVDQDERKVERERSDDSKGDDRKNSRETADDANPGNEKRKEKKRPAEEIVPGPTDQDPEEFADVVRLFGGVSDKVPMQTTDMPAHWRLMKWARARTFDQMEARARDNVFMRQFHEQPDRYRGKLARLRLHVKQIMEHDELAENAAGLERSYEMWGATDESKSYPYGVLVAELPPGMKTGDNLHEEVVFVGYFLKLMTYKASRGPMVAPMFIGKIQAVEQPGARARAAADNDAWYWTAGGALALVVGAVLWTIFIKRKQPAPDRHSISEASVEDWLSHPPEEPSPPVVTKSEPEDFPNS